MIRLLPVPVLLALFLGGCVNDRGISARYYNDCREYYDVRGYYHKKCDENLIEFKEVKESLKTEKPVPDSKVW